MNPELKEKVDRILQSTIYQEWLKSEMELSARYDRLEKARCGKMKNKIPLPRASHESD